MDILLEFMASSQSRQQECATLIIRNICCHANNKPKVLAYGKCRVDSRARECENPAYFVILAQNCDLGAPTIPQSTEKWRIFVSFVRIVVLFSTILVVNFRSFPLISVDHVVRDLTETSILLAETVNACAYVFLLSLSLTQDGVEIFSFLACDN